MADGAMLSYTLPEQSHSNKIRYEEIGSRERLVGVETEAVRIDVGR
jgi:hypothetical protein